MFLKCVVFACALVACLALPQPGAKADALPAAKPQPAAKPPAPTPPAPTPPTPAPRAGSPPVAPQVFCGETPNNVFKCLENPKVLVNQVVIRKCNRPLSECDKVKCIFREAGWSTASSMKDDIVNKKQVTEYYNQFAAENPSWSAAVQHLKAACLDKDLPAQGITQNCAAFDVFHCIQTSFLRNASPSQWLNTTECAYPRTYSTSCPICPTSCFAAQVPVGTCNACLSLPRTP